eukprot:TRINITY_DN41529_c0_g1_i1.p1 TRINITY_DN41529_c0_g1~~TRINITY_DN41529_c0_g1_i1.p1  ORF type:complete len:178 (-),score=26.74 TRINITY_DN41529_c0_g1_i1:63-596(-)
MAKKRALSPSSCLVTKAVECVSNPQPGTPNCLGPSASRRQDVCAKLARILSACGQEALISEADLDPQVMATLIEKALHAVAASEASVSYFAQARCILFNLKHGCSEQGSLYKRLATGLVLPEDLVLMSSEEMAPDKERAERSSQRLEAMEACTSKPGQPSNVFVTCGQIRGFVNSRR